MNDTFIERAVCKLFYIDIVNHIKLEAICTKEFHIPPGSFDNMPYWEYELWLEELQNVVVEENDRQKAEMDKYHIDEHMDAMRPGNMSKMTNKMMPKMPSVNMPAINMPKLGF